MPPSLGLAHWKTRALPAATHGALYPPPPAKVVTLSASSLAVKKSGAQLELTVKLFVTYAWVPASEVIS